MITLSTSHEHFLGHGGKLLIIWVRVFWVIFSLSFYFSPYNLVVVRDLTKLNCKTTGWLVCIFYIFFMLPNYIIFLMCTTTWIELQKVCKHIHVVRSFSSMQSKFISHDWRTWKCRFYVEVILFRISGIYNTVLV